MCIRDSFDIAAERNIGWGDVREMADDEVYRLFYPERHVRESAFEEPDWEYAVSYTHLDVYKRQALSLLPCGKRPTH